LIAAAVRLPGCPPEKKCSNGALLLFDRGVFPLEKAVI